ncbi:MAG: uroporphyrinogen decarboxylase family protein [Chloroflexota bacterium]
MAAALAHGDFYADVAINERTAIGGCKQQPISVFDRRFLLTPPEYIEISGEECQPGKTITYYRLHTPRGDLTCSEAVVDGEDTVWEVEPLIKDADDAAKLLSVPYRFDRPDLTAFFADRERLGDRGVVDVDVTTPMVMISRITGLQRFYEWTIAERPLLDRMLHIVTERLAERLRYVLDQGAGPIVKFGGSEQATPPMMSARFFDHFVLEFERPLWQMVRQAGRIVWVHCHGRVATVIEKFRDGGAQMFDPVEPPPKGDLEIGDAKARAAAGPMTLIGNIQMYSLQTCTADEIEALVQRALCSGGRGHFILKPCANIVSAIDDRLLANIVRFYEAGAKYGTFAED